MPLLDHFHPPLKEERHWDAFHARWAGAISDALNSELPSGYFAEMHVHVGSRVEIDVATFERTGGLSRRSPSTGAPGEGGATAVLEQAASPWAPPAPPMSMPAVFPDSIEVLVYETSGGLTLVAAVELVSPVNKDRPESRRAFAAKCSAYLQQGVGLLVVDIVTDRRANLHNELVELLGTGDQYRLGPEPLYAVAYGPHRAPVAERIDVWPAMLELGKPLPTLPLALDRRQFVPVDLDAAYVETCRRTRLTE